MTTVSDYQDLMATLQGAAIVVATTGGAEGDARTYRESRNAIAKAFSVEALPLFARRHRTAPELRSAAQMLSNSSGSVSSYAERRTWINGEISECLERVELTGQVLPPSGASVTAPSAGPSAILPSPIPAPEIVAAVDVITLPHYLHPDILSRSQGAFDRGEYDTAVFQAFRLIEVRLRERAGLPPSDIGLSMVTKALSPTAKEPFILQMSTVTAEQDGFHQMFRGVIAAFKNPQSHHEVGLNKAARIAELIGSSSSLLYMIEGADLIERAALTSNTSTS